MQAEKELFFYRDESPGQEESDVGGGMSWWVGVTVDGGILLPEVSCLSGGAVRRGCSFFYGSGVGTTKGEKPE